MADPPATEEPAEAKRTPNVKSQIPQKVANGTNAESQTPKASVLSSGRPATTTTPSAAAVQRALAKQSAASLDGVMEGTRDRLTKSGSNSPSWPTSPRLKSPPPSAGRIAARRDSSEHAQSNTAKRMAPVSAPDLAAAMLLPQEEKESAVGPATPSASLRVPPRATTSQTSGLETVVEGSVPTTPSLDPKSDPLSGAQTEGQDTDSKEEQSSAASSTLLNPDSKIDPRVSRASTNKAEGDSKTRAPSASRPASNLAKRSFTSLTGGKKATEPVRTMTIETEPVMTSTPGLGERMRESGSVRTKTSTETIRPKKEKKKITRKPIHAGNATKADIFEAKVASAVDERDTSDSDETFVYESNPPESRSTRHHSRTPSATSLASNNDHLRSTKHGMRSGSTAIPGKKSMKFSNSVHARDHDEDSRSSSRHASSTARHHHIGRYGRNNHPSLFDSDSPFSQARQPVSPRGGGHVFKNSMQDANGKLDSPRRYAGSAYDNNEDAADDERAPLLGTLRSGRNRHSRRPHSRDIRSLEMGEERERSCWQNPTSCGLLALVILIIAAGLGLLGFAVTRPLTDVELRKIVNVLASEQELMLDLDVRAVNPNLLPVTVSDIDAYLFAQSPYVGTSQDWYREHPEDPEGLSVEAFHGQGWFWPEPAHPDDGVDEGTDPEDPEGPQKMLLGRVQEFDSPLTFEPTPIRHSFVSSVAPIRLAKPGNKTEVGGSKRWERVLQHDFDLIIRGVIKYSLPLSSKVKSAKIAGRKTIHPDTEGDGPDHGGEGDEVRIEVPIDGLD